MNMDKWEIIASQGHGTILIDTKEPNPKIEGDTLCRMYFNEAHTVTPPLSLGQVIKQGYWDTYDKSDGMTASALLNGAKELADSSGTRFTGVILRSDI